MRLLGILNMHTMFYINRLDESDSAAQSKYLNKKKLLESLQAKCEIHLCK